MRIDTNAQHPASFKKLFRYNRSNSAFNSRLRQRKLKERRYRYSSLGQLSEDYTYGRYTFLFLTQNQHQLVNIEKSGHVQQFKWFGFYTDMTVQKELRLLINRNDTVKRKTEFSLIYHLNFFRFICLRKGGMHL